MHIVPSEEQQAIIDSAARGANIVVDAVAGSGKTTTILSIAKALPDKTIVQVTFNSQLKLEVREKLSQLGLKNITVHTYHSLATTFYDSCAWNDGKMLSVIENNTQPRPNHTNIKPTLIIIDEAQDMTMLYFQMVYKFITDMCDMENIQLIVMGDRHQAVYSFMQADARFLTLAPLLWKKEFEFMTLCESYRLTKPIAWFVNKSMVKHDRIVSNKPGVRVEYHICNPYNMPFLNDLLFKLKSGSLNPEDIFILSASLKSQGSPARSIENKLVSAGIPVYVPISDDARMDEDITRGKVIFATFPSSKGRERKVVVVLGFDAGYFKYFAKNDLPHICPSTLYVAATRAKERLIVVENNGDNPLPFLKMCQEDLATYVHISGHRKQLRNNKFEDNTLIKRKTSPVELVRYLKQSTIQGLTPLVNRLFNCIQPAAVQGVRVPSKIKSSKSENQYEDVSDLNGLVIPIMWEAKMGGNGHTTIGAILSGLLSLKDTAKVMKTAISKIKFNSENICDYIHMCNVYQAVSDGYHGRLAQIKKYDWLNNDMVEQCHKYLGEHVSSRSIEFEKVASHTIDTQFGEVTINSRIDAVTDDTIWEFKCVDELMLEHFLQLVVYAYVYNMSNTNVERKKTKILNIRNGELYELVYNSEIVDQIMDTLFCHKYTTATKESDEEFIDQLSLTISNQWQTS